MAKMPDTSAIIAATRLGFAARGGDLAAIGRDPRGWALAQLQHAAPPLPGLSSGREMVVAEFEMRRDRREKPEEGARRAFNERVRGVYLAEIAARTAAAAASETPLRLDNRKLERLIGAEPHTPLDEAVRQSLAALGCLPAATGAAAVVV